MADQPLRHAEGDLEAFAEVVALLDREAERGTFAGCGLSVWWEGAERLALTRGLAELRPRQRALRPRHPFDVASLTKVLCTTPLVYRLVSDGRLDLDAPVTELLPDGPVGVTPRHLLQHASGLPAWNRIYEAVEASGHPWGSDEARGLALELARTTPPEAAPGAQHRYSDLGFLTLGAVAEAAAGARLDRAWETAIRSPAGVDLRWGWPDAAATEDCPFRGRVVVGEVHDLNAAVMGGIAPHAGLFGSATAVAALTQWQLEAWQGAAQRLDPAVVRAGWADKGPGSHRLGWDGISPGGSSAGSLWPLDGVGHLGFTGCSVWVAPRQGVIVAFLSNRVHPSVEGGSVPDALADAPRSTGRYQAFRALRPALHTALASGLQRLGVWHP